MYAGHMPKSVQIRDVEDDVYAALVRHAADLGVSVPELMRREMARLAQRPPLGQWLAGTRRRPSTISREEIVDALDEVRGDWPDAGG